MPLLPGLSTPVVGAGMAPVSPGRVLGQENQRGAGRRAAGAGLTQKPGGGGGGVSGEALLSSRAWLKAAAREPLGGASAPAQAWAASPENHLNHILYPTGSRLKGALRA